MKQKTIIAAVLGCVTAGVLQVVALPIANPTYQDIDTFKVGNDYVVLKPGESVSGEFNIVTSDGDSWTVPNFYYPVPIRNMTFTDKAGYVPGSGLSSAQAYFYISGLAQNTEMVTIDLSSLDTSASTSDTYTGVSVSHWVFGGDIDITLLAALSADGILNYEIQNTSQPVTGITRNFYVKAAQLQAIGVPDGGFTLLLLGAGMSSLAMIRRKLA